MLKKIFIGAFLLALALSSCAPAVQAVETVTPSTAPTQATTSTSQATATKKPGCTAVSRRAEPNPTQEALLPPPGENDWVQGPEDAYVTFIEYGDYQ